MKKIICWLLGCNWYWDSTQYVSHIDEEGLVLAQGPHNECDRCGKVKE